VTALRLEVSSLGALNGQFFRSLDACVKHFLFVDYKAAEMMGLRGLWLSRSFPIAELSDADASDDDLRLSVFMLVYIAIFGKLVNLHDNRGNGDYSPPKSTGYPLARVEVG
jgi:hypothetical protein